jgi:CBS domain-containing protein
METIHEWLQDTQAAEVMMKQVVTFRPEDLLAGAITTLLQNQISGAPVVDQQGVCVGVLSATDILTCGERTGNGTRSKAGEPCRWFDSWSWGADWWREFGRVRHELEPIMKDTVSRHMTRDIVSVTEDVPLKVVIRQMVDAHIHRVLVLDSGRHLKGIITTMDILASALRAERREHPVAR